MRLRLDLAYDGSSFHGWARQPSLRTVQGELETALDRVLRTRGCALTVAGRTDAGVHARGQVAHLDLDPAALEAVRGRADDGSPALLAERLLRSLNGILAADVRVHRIRPVTEDFDARFSAVWRRYAYRLADRPESVDPLRRAWMVAWRRPLDLEAMNAAAAPLLGEHDFAAFCKPREGATTIRTLQHLEARRETDAVVRVDVRADAFCHHLVRCLVGALAVVGEGRRDADWPAQVLRAGVRDPAVPMAPGHGLTLEEVGYPDEDAFATRAQESRARRRPA